MAKLWLRGQIISANSKSEAILHIRGIYQSYISHFCDFVSEKASGTP